MSSHYCPICHETIPSEKKLNVHLALQHESYENGSHVRIESIRSLERVKDRVHYLLRKIPSTRSSDWHLFLLYNRYFNGLYVYNADTQTVQFRTVIGVPVSEFLHQTSFESIRRSRQWLQEHDSTLKPSERVEALRGAKEASYRAYFAKGGTSTEAEMLDAYNLK